MPDIHCHSSLQSSVVLGPQGRTDPLKVGVGGRCHANNTDGWLIQMSGRAAKAAAVLCTLIFKLFEFVSYVSITTIFVPGPECRETVPSINGGTESSKVRAVH